MSSNLKNKTIKVVAIDASAPVRQLFADVLRSLGFENVQGIGSIKDLYSLLEVEKVDWIISPVSSDQDFNILHLLQTIIDFPELRHTRVTAILEESELDLIPSLVERGGLGWLTKPFNKDTLTANLKQVLQDLEAFQFNETQYSLHKYDEYLEKKGRHEERIESIKNFILKINPGNPMFLMLLGKAYAGSGKHDLAKIAFKQAITLDPGLTAAAKEVSKTLLGSDEFLNEKIGVGGANLLGIDSVAIVDPDGAFNSELETALKEAGVPSVNCFGNGEEAWKWLETQEKVGLVIHEWKIPGLTGPLLLQRIRHKFPMAPVIVATSVFEESDKPLVHEMGVSAIISKPADRPKILNEIIYTIQQDRSPTDVDSLERKIRQSLVGKDFETAGKYRNQVRDDQSIPKARKLKIEAEFFLAENKFTEARDAGVAALKMSSDSIMLLSLLGKCFLRLGDYAASLKCFERAQMLSPMNIGRLCEIASAQSEIGKNAEAQEALDKAKSQDPSSPEVAEASAKVALNSGDVSEARSIMEKMESLSDIISYMNNRAVAHSKSGKSQEGVTLYKKTFDSIPQDRTDVKAIVKYNLALALVKQNSLMDAQNAINDALALGATKIEKKAISLRERIGKSIRDGVDFKLKTNDILPAAEIGSPSELLVKEENSASIEAVEKKAGDLGCYKIVKDTMPHELINKMLQKKQPRFMPRESIKRAETLGVDKAS